MRGLHVSGEKKIHLGHCWAQGGVGKTTISANLAIALSGLGKRVVAVDLDLGTSNLHAIFGLRESKYTLDDFVSNRVRDLINIVLDTDINGLQVIFGSDIPDIANLPYQKKLKLIRHLSKLDSDFTILDLGAGVSYNVVDFLIIAQKAFLVTTPEVPSLLNVYSFIKTLVYRWLTFDFKQARCFELLELLEKAKDPDNNLHLKTMAGMLREVRKVNTAAADSAEKILLNFRPVVIVNRAQTKDDARTGNVIQKLMRQYLSIESAVIMTIREDNSVKDALARLRPIMIESPASVFSRDVRQIAQMLCGPDV